MPKYPDVEVELSSGSGNAVILMRKVKKALRRAGVSPEEVEEFAAEAMSGDYDHVIQTCMAWVDVS